MPMDQRVCIRLCGEKEVAIHIFGFEMVLSSGVDLVNHLSFIFSVKN